MPRVAGSNERCRDPRSRSREVGSATDFEGGGRSATGGPDGLFGHRPGLLGIRWIAIIKQWVASTGADGVSGAQRSRFPVKPRHFEGLEKSSTAGEAGAPSLCHNRTSPPPRGAHIWRYILWLVCSLATRSGVFFDGSAHEGTNDLAMTSRRGRIEYEVMRLRWGLPSRTKNRRGLHPPNQILARCQPGFARALAGQTRPRGSPLGEGAHSRASTHPAHPHR